MNVSLPLPRRDLASGSIMQTFTYSDIGRTIIDALDEGGGSERRRLRKALAELWVRTVSALKALKTASSSAAGDERVPRHEVWGAHDLRAVSVPPPDPLPAATFDQRNLRVERGAANNGDGSIVLSFLACAFDEARGLLDAAVVRVSLHHWKAQNTANRQTAANNQGDTAEELGEEAGGGVRLVEGEELQLRRASCDWAERAFKEAAGGGVAAAVAGVAGEGGNTMLRASSWGLGVPETPRDEGRAAVGGGDGGESVAPEHGESAHDGDRVGGDGGGEGEGGKLNPRDSSVLLRASSWGLDVPETPRSGGRRGDDEAMSVENDETIAREHRRRRGEGEGQVAVNGAAGDNVGLENVPVLGPRTCAVVVVNPPRGLARKQPLDAHNRERGRDAGGAGATGKEVPEKVDQEVNVNVNVQQASTKKGAKVKLTKGATKKRRQQPTFEESWTNLVHDTVPE